MTPPSHTPRDLRPSLPRAGERHVTAPELATLDRVAEETLRGANPQEQIQGLPQIVDGDRAHPSDFVSLEPVARGGMAVIERALQCSVGRDVALKRVRPEHDAGAFAALVHEARAMAHFDHPSIPPVFALGRDDHGLPVLAMKYVEGVTWQALLQDPQHPLWALLPTDRLQFHLRVLARVADAAHHAHLRGWLHRDIKPANVMVTARGDVSLIDWGLAVRLPVEGPSPASSAPAPAGTPRYMAPEMVQGVGPWLSPRTDVYLLGASLHEVLMGKALHEGGNVQETLFAALQSERHEYPASVPRELAALAQEATSRDPDGRPLTAEAFGRRIEDFLRHGASVRGPRAASTRAAWCALALVGLGLAMATDLPTPHGLTSVAWLAVLWMMSG